MPGESMSQERAERTRNGIAGDSLQRRARSLRFLTSETRPTKSTSVVFGFIDDHLELVARTQIGRCRPGLEALAHGPPRLRMRPFVELPIRTNAGLAELG